MFRILILFPILASSAAFCQTYHPLIRANTYWDVHHGYGPEICSLSGGDQYYFDGDTVFMGVEYAIVRSYPIVSLQPVPYCPPFAIDSTTSNIKAFMREDTLTRIVYVFDTNTQSDELLYHFGLQEGDTLGSEYAGQGLTLIVDSVGTTTLFDGGVRNIFYLNNGELYIESIGGSQGLWFPLFMGIGFWEVPLCVRENGITLWGDQCFGYLGTVGIEGFDVNGTIIFPNPSSGSIQVHSWNERPVTLTIFDRTGRVVRTLKAVHGEVIEIGDLPSQAYIYQIGTDGHKGRLILIR